jgi:hypothetical protein
MITARHSISIGLSVCGACSAKATDDAAIIYDAPNYANSPSAGNPSGDCAIPAGAMAEDVSHPDQVVGDGTPQSCTGDAFVAAVAKGGLITFKCGSAPVTITLTETAKVFNQVNGVDTQKVVIDGGGLVTLSGDNKVRILYQDTCDQSLVWTTSACQNQPYPQLTVQNITFIQGNSTGQDQEGGGGGAILARGGQLKIVNARFFNNVCESEGSDLGGAAVRALSQYNGLPLYVVNSTFGGAQGFGNDCANGGALSSIDVTWDVINSEFSYNSAVGHGSNSGQGGNGGAIYTDGSTYDVTVCGSDLENNTANEGGEAIVYFATTGHLYLTDSTLKNNTGGKYDSFPGIYIWPTDPSKLVNTNSVIE